jgi:hypothetical protein
MTYGDVRPLVAPASFGKAVHRIDTKRVMYGKQILGSLKIHEFGLVFQPNAEDISAMFGGLSGTIASMQRQSEKYGIEVPLSHITGGRESGRGFVIKHGADDETQFTFPEVGKMTSIFEAVAVATGRTFVGNPWGFSFEPGNGVVGPLTLDGRRKPRKWSEIIATGFILIAGTAIVIEKIVHALN